MAGAADGLRGTGLQESIELASARQTRSRVSAQHCFRALRVRTCREPRRRAGHSRQIPPMRFPTEARDEYPSWRSSSDCPIVQVRPIPRSRD